MKKSRGFTLMELLIVMVLLGVLVSMGTGSYISSTKRGRDNRRKSDLRNVTLAFEAYFSDKGKYPPSNENGEIVACGATETAVCPWGEEFKDSKNTLYMALLPKEAREGMRYFYVGTATTYKLYATLENTKDESDGVKKTGYDTKCDTANTIPCTYGIASSNSTP